MSNLFDFIIQLADKAYQSKRETIARLYGMGNTSAVEVANKFVTEAKVSPAQKAGLLQKATAQSDQ